MTAADDVAIRLCTPTDLIETVPYLLGFHPEESLVIVGLGAADDARLQAAPGRPLLHVRVVIRIDLLGQPGQAQWQSVIGALDQSEVRSVALVFFSSSVSGDPRRDPRWVGWAAAAHDVLGLPGYPVVDLLIADDARWWSMLCERDACCPAEGTPRARGCSSVAAQAVVAGMVALPDRESLQAMLDCDSETGRRALSAHLVAAERRLSRAAAMGRVKAALAADVQLLRRAARSSTLIGRPVLSSHQLARIGVALRDIATRDEIWLAVDEGSLDAGDCLQLLLRRLPAPYDVAPLVLFGWHQWRHGNGTLAMVCAERALVRDPGYASAMLLSTAVQNGLNPRTTPSLRSTMGDAFGRIDR